MSPSIVNEQDLFLPLVEGFAETPPWSAFMTALVARTGARHAVLFIALANAPADHEPTILHLAAPRAVQEPKIDIAALFQLGLHPYGSLRPGRVYAMDEMLNFDDAKVLSHQRSVLHAMGIRYGRWLRVSADGIADAWILVTRERDDLSASAVATLSAIGPYLRAALRAYVVLCEQRLLRIVAQTALSRLGVGQVALDESARIMGADELAKRHLAFVEIVGENPGRKLQLPPAASEQVEAYCARCSQATGQPLPPSVIRTGDDLALLLQPATFAVLPGMARPTAIASFRLPQREDEAHGAAILRDQYHLSAREAALAERLSRGDKIVEAGRRLHLTDETARNYSKRIYAQTGSRGQADLVRSVLSGLAPLA